MKSAIALFAIQWHGWSSIPIALCYSSRKYPVTSQDYDSLSCSPYSSHHASCHLHFACFFFASSSGIISSTLHQRFAPPIMPRAHSSLSLLLFITSHIRVFHLPPLFYSLFLFLFFYSYPLNLSKATIIAIYLFLFYLLFFKDINLKLFKKRCQKKIISFFFIYSILFTFALVA